MDLPSRVERREPEARRLALALFRPPAAGRPAPLPSACSTQRRDLLGRLHPEEGGFDWISVELQAGGVAVRRVVVVGVVRVLPEGPGVSRGHAAANGLRRATRDGRGDPFEPGAPRTTARRSDPSVLPNRGTTVIMLTAHAPGQQGTLLFLGFDPADLAHLVANEPLNIEVTKLGISPRPMVILFETDPMVAFYAAQPWVTTILFRQTTIDAMRATPGGMVELPLPVSDLPANTIAMLFFGEDDKALLEVMRTTGLAQPAPVYLDAAPPAAHATSASPGSPPQRTEPFWGNLFGAVTATGLAGVCFVGPFVWHVKNVPGVLAFGVLFGAGAAVLWREQWRRR